MLPGFHIPELPTSRTLRAAWRIFVARNLGWTNCREESCINGFSTEVNFHLRNSFFANGETQGGCSRRSMSDLAIPAILVNSSPSPPSPSTASTTAVGELPPMCKQRTCSPPSWLRSASSSLPHSPVSTATCIDYDPIWSRSHSPRRLPAWMQRAAADVHPSAQHLWGFANTLWRFACISIWYPSPMHKLFLG